MPTVNNITPKYSDRIPLTLEDGVLYISEKYATAAHNCCCGCKTKIVTPLKEGRWTLTKNNNRVSLDPSIGNWSSACQSHYWIKNNSVQWAKKFSKAEIAANRASDKKVLEAAHAARRDKKRSLWQRFVDWIKSWF